MEFIKAVNIAKYDPNPYVLIDKSGSTADSCKITNENQTILNAEVDIAYQILCKVNSENCHLLLWDSRVELEEEIKVSELLENNKKYSKRSSGGTNLTPALKKVVTDVTVNKKQNKDLYIITDGEICDTNEIGKPLADLFAENINIYIITVEPNNKNYLSKNCSAGNSLYSYLNKNSKMNFVKKITQYNNFHQDGFVTLNNFDVPNGYLPFRDDIFLQSDFSKFTNFLKDEISSCDTNEKLLKLAHDLSRTLFYLSKNKETNVRQIIVNNLSNYFKNTSIYNEVRNLLLKEIDNHINHKSSTFQDYRTRRNELFERSQLNLMDNTKLAITNNSTQEYISLPMKTNKGIYIFTSNEKLINGSINLGKLTFRNAGLKLNNGVIPIFPSDIISNESNDQCLRQWIRANYSYIYNTNIVSGKILCLLLLDMLRVHLSDVSNKIKHNYTLLAHIMLNAKTYGTDTSIISELLNKKQLPSYDYFSKYISDNHYNFSTGCLWFAILKCLNRVDLLESQKHIYLNDVTEFCTIAGIPYDENLLLNLIKNCLNPNIHELQYNQKYILPDHEVLDSILCTNNYLDEVEFNSSQYPKCYVCGKQFDKSNILINNQNSNIQDLDIMEEYYQNNQCKNIKLKLDNSTTLLKINELDFKCQSYNIENVILTDILNTVKLLITTKEEFIEKVNQKYLFMKDLDMENVCLAGGFVRSILLGQRMKDFDFFVYGSEDPLKRVSKLIEDLTSNIRKTHQDPDKYKFLYMYKPLFNVFEMVYIEDPTNHFNDRFTVKNFSKYKYDSLKTYDRRNTKKRDQYYFEDGDSKGIKIKYRFQFILCKFNSIENIFNSFDMTPSCVAYDGKDVYFTKDSYESYKYMVNIVKNNTWTYLFDPRMSKYLSYGFDIAFPEQDIVDINDFKKKFESTDNFVQLCSLKFDINKIIDNKVIIKHDSHKKELFENLNEIEKNCQNEGKSGLYRSSLFCSLVSLLRYVCINDMLYEFSTDKLLPDENGNIKFRNGQQKLVFIDKFVVQFENNKWYTDHRYIPPRTLIRENENCNELDNESDDSEDDSENDSKDSGNDSDNNLSDDSNDSDDSDDSN